MDILNKIKALLKKKKESIVVDLYLKDYDHANFYFALVFNRKIEKFKVLFVPIDSIGEGDSIEDYFCYQFVFVQTVHYILDSIHKNEELCEKTNRYRKCPTMDAYFIEVSTHAANKDYSFTFSQYISKDFYFLFDIIVTLFEHSPNIVSELCEKILMEFNSSQEVISFNGSFEFDLWEDPYERLFSKEVLDSNLDVSFLENAGAKYYAIVKDQVVVIEYLPSKKDFHVNSGNYELLGEEVYAVVKAIREENYHDFYRAQVVEHTEDFQEKKNIRYYLCYGVEKDSLKIVSYPSHHRLPISFFSKKLVKIFHSDLSFQKSLRESLSLLHKESKVSEIIDFTVVS